MPWEAERAGAWDTPYSPDQLPTRAMQRPVSPSRSSKGRRSPSPARDRSAEAPRDRTPRVLANGVLAKPHERRPAPERRREEEKRREEKPKGELLSLRSNPQSPKRLRPLDRSVTPTRRPQSPERRPLSPERRPTDGRLSPASPTSGSPGGPRRSPSPHAQPRNPPSVQMQVHPKRLQDSLDRGTAVWVQDMGVMTDNPHSWNPPQKGKRMAQELEKELLREQFELKRTEKTLREALKAQDERTAFWKTRWARARRT